MRLLFLGLTMMAALLAGSVIAQVAPPDSGSATPSLLAPGMPEAPPLPTPLSPPTPLAPPTPFSSATIGLQPMPVPQTTEPSAPAQDQGRITAEPLPPPDGVPFAPPPPATPEASRPASIPDPGMAAPSGEGTSTVVGAPVSLTPIPLALPHATLPSAYPTSGAQSTGTQSAGPIVSNRLATPALSPEASPADFLRAARGALVTGRNGEARSALEMAQTRLLDRSVDVRKESLTSDNLAVKQITDAINALVTNDRMACLRYIEFASQTIGSPLD